MSASLGAAAACPLCACKEQAWQPRCPLSRPNLCILKFVTASKSSTEMSIQVRAFHACSTTIICYDAPCESFRAAATNGECANNLAFALHRSCVDAGCSISILQHLPILIGVQLMPAYSHTCHPISKPIPKGQMRNRPQLATVLTQHPLLSEAQHSAKHPQQLSVQRSAVDISSSPRYLRVLLW